ncbi:MAG: hypothetical protein IKG81_00535 [Bacteroidales bacterium]|nr:hypothetical protein [Bacteroidales bacterium]
MKIMNKAAALLLVLLTNGATAQVDSSDFYQQRQQMRERYERQKGLARQQYGDARRKAEAEYAAFRKRANEEYAAAAGHAWTKIGVEPAIPKPKEPEPPKPPEPQPNKKPSTDPLPKGEVVTPPIKADPVPSPPIPEPEPSVPTVSFDFYGSTCSVHANSNDLQFKLPSLDEKSISKAWQQLSQEKYDGLLHDCIAQREALRLSDWGYICLLRSMSGQLLGKNSNEAVLLQMYLLAQSGYRVRIAREDDHLVLLVPFDHTIYNYSYINIDNIRHYVLSNQKGGSVHVCEVAFPKEQVAKLQMNQLPKLNSGKNRNRTLQSQRYSAMKATVEVDKGLIDFMNGYPLSDAWEYYALAGLSDVVKSTLYPVLRSQIRGKSKKDAAEMLLNFVQTTFDYATDQDQFGYERPLFGDESIFYPKNDCEDRSIFYSILVRDLLGLDVVLVHWPGHLATAVAFPEEVAGDYFPLDGHKYTVCDPTYIGASIGQTMPQFKEVNARLIKL